MRLHLTGIVAEGTRLDCALIEEQFGAALGSLEVRNEARSFDFEAIAREPTVRGHVVRDLLTTWLERDGEAGRDAETALRYALAAFEGTEIAP